MLGMTRKPGQSLLIGDTVVVVGHSDGGEFSLFICSPYPVELVRGGWETEPFEAQTLAKGDFLKIGEQIMLSIGKVGDRKIKVGVQAPEKVLVLRGELYGAPAE